MTESSWEKIHLRVWVHIHLIVATHAAGHRFGAFLTLLWESCDQYAAYSNFPRLLSIVIFSLWGSNSLSVGTENIFPSKILKFGRRFERVEKNFNFSTRDPGHLLACAHACMVQAFLKINFFGATHGTSQNGISLRSPSLIMAPCLVIWNLSKY